MRIVPTSRKSPSLSETGSSRSHLVPVDARAVRAAIEEHDAVGRVDPQFEVIARDRRIVQQQLRRGVGAAALAPDEQPADDRHDAGGLVGLGEDEPIG